MQYCIYRVKENKWADLLDRLGAEDEDRTYREFAVREQYEGTKIFILHPPIEKPPPWIRLINTVVDPEEALPVLLNASNAFVLTFEKPNSKYLVTGGTAIFHVDEFLDDSFGLVMISKLVKPSTIKQVREKALVGREAQKEIVYRGTATYNTLEWLRITKEIVAEVDTADLNPKLGLDLPANRKVSVGGKMGLKLGFALTVPELFETVDRVDQLFANAASEFSLERGISEVVDEVILDELKAELHAQMEQEYLRYLNDPELPELSIGISLENPADFLANDRWFLQPRAGIGQQVDYLTLECVFEAYQDMHPEAAGLSPSFEEDFLLIGRDSLDLVRTKQTIQKSLFAEVTLNGVTYLLSDGRFYEASDTFLEQTRETYTSLLANNDPDVDAELTEWQLEDGKLEEEGHYIGRICVNGITQFHVQWMHFSRWDKCELCDAVIRDTGIEKLAFIKRGAGSALRELCSQARVVAELLMQNDEFRTVAQTKASLLMPNCPPANWKQTEVILAFVDTRDTENPLSTIIMADIVLTYRYLTQELGVSKVIVKEIVAQTP